MTPIQVHIDEVPVKATGSGLELTSKDDTEACGLLSFCVDVKIEDDGHWDLTQIAPVTGTIGFGANLKIIRGKNMVGPFALTAAKFLEDFAFFQIDDAVKQEVGKSAKLPHVARVG